MERRTQQFQTIRTEGAILPPDILRRIASLNVDGATPDAYHLPPGSKLNEAISQSWTSLLNHWQAFQEARANLPEDEQTGTSLTNERWLLPLFKELDYGRLLTTKSPEIDERVYPIERFYNHTPIHLIGCKLPLDRRTKGARGAATASPHSMIQEFLNRSEEHLWAFLSNGLQLRILRDNISLSRQAFIEFDLEAMMDGEVYADFALLWLLAHQSRVESDKAVECWLEKWSKLARDQGTRVLNDLRVGVAKAIEALGRGFIGHSRNDRLREKLQTGSLSKDEFYRQLLRTVYRLLFLFVAEDRELLHPPLPEGEAGSGEDDERLALQQARDLYDRHYSTRRLRELAHKIRGSKHADLWYSLSLVFDALSRNEGCPELGLSGLGSFLWRASSTADLLGPGQQVGKPEEDKQPDTVLITNDDLLRAVRALAYVEQDKVLRIVDYRNLGSEELGSVYESLLELHPVMNAEAKAFELSTAAGNERKTTGSYYTPDSLVQCLLDSALDPVVEERLKSAKELASKAKEIASNQAAVGKKKEQELPSWFANLPESEQQSLLVTGYSPLAEKALLSLKVCDPACGSGHFLIAAAHRVARHLARVRTGETEPGPEEYQHALRDVISHCIYGVDINPMAVELCKVSLWVDAIEPGKPFSFLDHHIQCGNSLLGATPALLEKGIPDDAFEPIAGDDKDVCKELKRDNNRERRDYESGQGYLFSPTFKLGNLPATISEINATREDSIDDVAAKQEMYEKLVKGAAYINARLLADTWCAAFVWKKEESDLGRLCPTERVFRDIEDNPHNILPHVKAEVVRLSDEYQFFHWHLAFPDVFQRPEKGKNADKEQAGWNGGFDVVLGNPPWIRQEGIKSMKKLLRVFLSFSSTADLSIYFTELAALVVRLAGRVGILTPNKWFRAGYGVSLRVFLKSHALVRFVVDFGHAKKLFGDADTFPAAIVFEPINGETNDTTFSFVRAFDIDRQHHSLPTLIKDHTVDVPLTNLTRDSWRFDSVAVSEVVRTVNQTGTKLRDYLCATPKYGIKTGFNDAFYLDHRTASCILESNPDSDQILKPFIRGRDIHRWRLKWEGQWHIVIPSSLNVNWRWSCTTTDKEAEDVFASTFPLVHNHLKPFETSLKARSDQGKYWWELRSCEYYEDFAKPKIAISRISYHSEVALDTRGYFQNDSTVFLPCDDLFVLALLNSPLGWWYMTRTFPHKKDEALSMDVEYLGDFPVPAASIDQQEAVRSICRELQNPDVDIADSIALEQQLSVMIFDVFELSDRQRHIVRQNGVVRDPIDRLQKLKEFQPA